MLKYVLSLMTLLTPHQSFAILDFVGQAAKGAVESAAYADAASELLSEIDDSSEIAEGAAGLDQRAKRLNSQVSEVYYTSSDVKGLLDGPDWSGRRLEHNMRFTSRYIKRVKRLLIRLGLVGTDVATAMNTAETNSALNEVLRNQQAQILLQKESKIEASEKEFNQHREWEEFLKAERENRSDL